MPGVAHPNTLQYVLVGLVRHRPMHGYELFQALEQQTALGLLWHVKQPHIYAMLAKLEEEGWLTGAPASVGLRPPRRVMRVTELGADAFDRWFTTPVRHGRDFRQEFLAQLYFAQNQGIDAVKALVQRQYAASTARRDLLAAQRDHLATDQPFDRLVFDFRLRQMETILAWLDACQAAFQSADEAHPAMPPF